MLIDTHAHLYHHRLIDDLSDVLGKARDAGVTKIIMPAIDVPSIERALVLCDRFPGLYAMAALHPTDTRDAGPEAFDAVAAFCDHPRVVAVGESGLDYYWDRSFDVIQQEAYRWHIRLAVEKNLPLILHTRDKKGHDEAHRDIVRILRSEYGKVQDTTRLRGILHCFTGPAWMAAEAAEMGFLLGIGGVVTFKNGGLDVLVRDIPLQQIVLETDAPFLAPAPYRGKRNEPSYVRLVARKLAAVKQLSVQEVEHVTTENALQLFDLSPSYLSSSSTTS